MAQVMTAVVNTSTVETEATIRIPLTFIMQEGLDILQIRVKKPLLTSS